MENQCSCGETADTHASLKVYCSTCSNVLLRKIYKRPFKSAFIGIVLSYGGLNFVEYAITDNRYPLKTEFAILNACMSPNQMPVARGVYGERQEMCLCALEDTMNEISHIRYLVNKNGFLDAFEANASKCS